MELLLSTADKPGRKRAKGPLRYSRHSGHKTSDRVATNRYESSPAKGTQVLHGNPWYSGGWASSHKIRCNGRDVAQQRLAAHDLARAWVGTSLFERSPAQPRRCGPTCDAVSAGESGHLLLGMRCHAAYAADEAGVGLVTSPHVPARLVARSFAALDRGIRFSLTRADAIECGRSASIGSDAVFPPARADTYHYGHEPRFHRVSTRRVS